MSGMNPWNPLQAVGASAAKREQDELAGKGFSLSHWYGTWCEPCCGVYPAIMTCGSQADDKAYYQCPACGKRNAESFDMPWQARDAWNNGETVYDSPQMALEVFA